MRITRVDLFPVLGPGDDLGFVDALEPLLRGAIISSGAERAYFVGLDNWFGPKWYKFSHVVRYGIGHVSWWNGLLRVPPFRPSRVSHQYVYDVKRREGGVELCRMRAPEVDIHVEQVGEDNAQRAMGALYAQSAMCWWSGNTERNGRGAAMCYVPTPEGHAGWYLEWSRGEPWRVSERRGISVTEQAALERLGAER